MHYGWHDLAGSLGVAMMVLAYLLLQMGKLRSEDLNYSLANGIGSALVLFSLLFKFNFSAFLVEGFWLLISLFGLFKFATRSRHRS